MTQKNKYNYDNNNTQFSIFRAQQFLRILRINNWIWYTRGFAVGSVYRVLRQYDDDNRTFCN